MPAGTGRDLSLAMLVLNFLRTRRRVDGVSRPARLRKIYPQAGAKRFLPYLNTLSHSPRTALKLRWAATQSLRPISFTLLRSIRNGRTFAGGV